MTKLIVMGKNSQPTDYMLFLSKKDAVEAIALLTAQLANINGGECPTFRLNDGISQITLCVESDVTNEQREF